MNLLHILYTIFYIFLFLSLMFVTVKQYKNMKNYATLFISIAILSILGLAIEMVYIETEKNIKDFTLSNEMNRVCWRRAMPLSFFILLILNNFYSTDTVSSTCISVESINISIYFLTFFLLYFYFNFDMYHRYNSFSE